MVYVIRDFFDSGLNAVVLFLADASPLPTAVPAPAPIDPERVSPGMLGLYAVLFLAAAAALIYVFLRGSLRKIDYDEDATLDESKPLDEHRPTDDGY